MNENNTILLNSNIHLLMVVVECVEEAFPLSGRRSLVFLATPTCPANMKWRVNGNEM